MASKDLVPQTTPDHPPSQFLGAEEVEAIKIARRALPEAMRNLVNLATRSKSESQRRQAIEKLFEFGLASRQQQFDMQTYEPVDKDATGQAPIQLTLNKVELRLTEIMQNMPPELAVRYAELLEEIEGHARDINMPIIDGDDLIVEAVEEGPECGCGCGQPVNKYRSGPKRGQWAEFCHGHHLRGHMTHKRFSPPEIRRLKAAGQWPPKGSDGEVLVGIDRAKLSKKEKIKARNKARREAGAT